MAQLTIYIDDETRRGIEQAARASGMSVSGWVKERLTRSLRSEWPEGYFENVIGSLADDDIQRPEALPESLDVPREEL